MTREVNASLIEVLTANETIWLAVMWQQLNYIEALKTISKSKGVEIRLASGPGPQKKEIKFPIKMKTDFDFNS